MKVNLRSSRLFVYAVLLAAGTLISTFAFVPTCEQELAKAYPAILKADLSTCGEQTIQALQVNPKADIRAFSSRLTGTWELKARTVRGIMVDPRDFSTRLYFDIRPGSRVTGVALLLDRLKRGPAGSAPAAELAAFWKVDIGQQERKLISLSMKGESRGSQTYAQVRDIRNLNFFDFKGVFVALGDTGATSTWNRLILMPKSFTYISCEDGVVERYAKVSDQKPLIAGLSLEAAWEALTTKGDIASLSGREAVTLR